MVSRARAGFTLIELIVVIVLLGIMASVAAIAFMDIRRPAKDADAGIMIAEARRQASQSQRPVTMMVTSDGRQLSMTVFPTGVVVADSALDIDMLTGRPVSDAR